MVCSKSNSLGFSEHHLEAGYSHTRDRERKRARERERERLLAIRLQLVNLAEANQSGVVFVLLPL